MQEKHEVFLNIKSNKLTFRKKLNISFINTKNKKKTTQKIQKRGGAPAKNKDLPVKQ